MLQAVIFDKDGTLFDFTKSWGAWTTAVLQDIPRDAGERARLAQALRFHDGRFAPDSPVIASTTPEVAALVHRTLPDRDAAALLDRLVELSVDIPMVPAVDLRAVLGGLRALNLVLGLATNDTEAPARAHLAGAGVLDLFDFVAGCDSGWGGKPEPGQLHAFARAHDLDPARVAMVGDSRHDLHAARAAGMKAVAVLTGVATAEDLAPHADVVLPDISGLAGWIAGLPTPG